MMMKKMREREKGRKSLRRDDGEEMMREREKGRKGEKS